MESVARINERGLDIMTNSIELLAILYHRIKQHRATDDEKNEFDLAVKMSCMDEQILMSLIKEKERTIKN